MTIWLYRFRLVRLKAINVSLSDIHSSLYNFHLPSLSVETKFGRQTDPYCYYIFASLLLLVLKESLDSLTHFW